MLYKIHLLQPMWRRISQTAVFPYMSLLVLLLPLLLFNSGQNSLMAHDEGLYAWRSRQMFDSGDWIAPWGNVHHKTPGPYWLIAIAYELFGVSELSVRLPSMIAGILAILLIYEIAKIILNQKLAWLAAAILIVEFLWLQYCRLGTPDVPMICLVILAIWSLLKAELHPKYCYFWSLIAGLSLGLGFLVRSFMIFVPIIALLPYLIGEHRRHRHLANPILYLGFVVGLIPTLSWLWFNWLRYGNGSFEELFKFVIQQNSHPRYPSSVFFYVWNVPLKSFPWGFFSLLGLFLVLRRPIPRYHLLLVGFPVVLFVEISLFSTRLSHYSLSLFPFIAMLAAIGLDWLARIYQIGLTKKNIPRNLSYACGVLGILFLLAGVVAFAWNNADIRKYAIFGWIVGLGWLILPLIWIARYRFNQKFLTARYWMAGWLIPCWLALAVAGSLGLLSDYNPRYRAFFQQSAIAPILQTHPIYFVQVGGKNSVLLNFYTPIHGQQVDTVSQLPAFSYAWINTNQTPQVSTPHRVVGAIQNYQLIQVLSQDR
ncbi:glycosyltransferase family 39 protein [Nostoc sp. CENA67]|uniref:Glycosyltransferase family 39 protein n=1 Tax=Amazonocrinis nigriterrae CENA67 TaxID=2794033 RepID=A0A8J7HW28_9NOST|nr:glycosyltransferase family 39 protein [Amazonocrinis nigriterrae]MBH8564332.1 glycosyltransferase family 39 protein [Amazonocrinis nigriterrae CENA67]